MHNLVNKVYLAVLSLTQHRTMWPLCQSDTLRMAPYSLMPKGVSMTKVAAFHTTGIEDVDELVFHNQSECPVGQEIKKKGTSAPGQGYFRTLCIKCQGIEDGWERNPPF